MIVHDCIQGSEAWLLLRRGVFSASEFAPFFYADGKVAEKARKSYVFRKLAEIAEDPEPMFESWAMKRGKELEPLARAAYSKQTGLEVEQVGFVMMSNNRIGCSPDAFTNGRKSGAEIKCPLGKTHLEYLDAGVCPDEYLHQVHGSMIVSGAATWDFYSWHPKLPPLLVTVKRDELTEKLTKGLFDMVEQFEAMRAWIESKWDEWNEARKEMA